MSAGNAQNDQKVSLVVTSTGATLNEATGNALRNAIEQAFGTFISSNTEILNDSLVQDKVVSISNGNIENFDVLSYKERIDGTIAVTLKAVVSISSLTDFVTSQGGSIDVKGGTFIFNMRKEQFYAESEIIALRDFLSSRLEVSNFFDFTISSDSPKIHDENDYIIGVDIGVKANDNLFSFFSDFWELLENISLSQEMVSLRTNSNLKSYEVNHQLKDVHYLYSYYGNANPKCQSYYLRSSKSFELVSSLDSLLFYQTQKFKIRCSDIDEMKLLPKDIQFKTIANNFVIFNRTLSPNPGVYWHWLPYIPENALYSRYRGGLNQDKVTLTEEYIRNPVKQSLMNKHSSHLGSVILNDQLNFNMVYRFDLIFAINEMERLNTIDVIPHFE